MRRNLFATLLVLAFLPSLRAQTPCHAENDGPNFADNVSCSSVYFGIQFTAPSTFTATRLEIFTGEVTATHLLGIWTHDATLNRPGTALSSGTMPVTQVNQWYSATMAANIPINAGQTYWFVWNSNNGDRRASTR